MPTVSGVYSLPPSYKATSGQTIRTEQHNPPLEDIAQALTDRLPRDGSAPMMGDLNMNGFRITGIAANEVLSGMIVLWSGSAAGIPDGWSLCDGNNGTPDLRGRFIIGAGGAYAVADMGGSESVTLISAQMPQHNHTFSGTTNNSGNHAHVYDIGQIAFSPGAGVNAYTGGFTTRTTQPAGDHTHTVSGNTGNAGGVAGHENRPPYYALCYIRKN